MIDVSGMYSQANYNAVIGGTVNKVTAANGLYADSNGLLGGKANQVDASGDNAYRNILLGGDANSVTDLDNAGVAGTMGRAAVGDNLLYHMP